MTFAPKQSPLVFSACAGACQYSCSLPRAWHNQALLIVSSNHHPAQNCPLTGGSCQSRRLEVTSNTGTNTAALMAGSGKAALAEET